MKQHSLHTLRKLKLIAIIVTACTLLLAVVLSLSSLLPTYELAGKALDEPQNTQSIKKLEGYQRRAHTGQALMYLSIPFGAVALALYFAEQKSQNHTKSSAPRP